LLAFDELALKPGDVLRFALRCVVTARQIRMRERVTLDVDARICHLANLLPRECIRSLSDDVRINEYRERKSALLQLRKRLGIRAAPSIIECDHDRIARKRSALAQRVLVDMTKRDDGVAGHLEIAQMLAKRVSRHEHAWRRRTLDDVIAEDRRARRIGGVPMRCCIRSDREGDEEEDRKRAPRDHGFSALQYRGRLIFGFYSCLRSWAERLFSGLFPHPVYEHEHEHEHVIPKGSCTCTCSCS